MAIKKDRANVVPKYIIEDSKLVLGKVAYHVNLVKNITKVQGGGMFTINMKEKTLFLFGDSYKLGHPQMEALQTAVDNWKVYTSKKQKTKLDDRFKITIKLQDGTIKKLN